MVAVIPNEGAREDFLLEESSSSDAQFQEEANHHLQQNILEDDPSTDRISFIRSSTSGSTHQSPLQRRARYAVGAMLFGCILGVILDRRRIEAASIDFLTWIPNHPYQAVLAVIFVYSIATILFIPGSVLTVGTGYAFASAHDSLFVGLVLSSIVSFSSTKIRTFSLFAADV